MPPFERRCSKARIRSPTLEARGGTRCAEPGAAMVARKRRLILCVLAVPLLVFLYRAFTVYTVRSGECHPRPVDPSLRLRTRDEHGTPVSFPARIGFPPQRRPLVVMTYNMAGHDGLTDGD